MNCETALERIRELNRYRQQKYYEAHRELLNEKRRERYAKGKPTEPIQPIEPAQLQIINVSKDKDLTYDEVVKHFNELIMTDGTRKKYMGDLKRLTAIIECKNFIKCLKQFKKVIKKIDESDYSINTKKSLLQTIVFMNTRLTLNLPDSIINPYKKEFEILKLKSIDDTEKKSKRDTMSFKDYLEKIKELGDEKMYVLTRLYDEVTLRDDFILKIADTKPTDTTDNYIVIGPKLTVIINKYKTSSKYGKIEVKLSALLSKLVKKYIKDEDFKEGDYLFGSTKLSSFISTNNKKIGVKGGVNEMRHMKITDVLKQAPSEKQRVELASKMKHTPLVQLRYLRT